MNREFRSKPASQEEMNLYILVGEALCMSQHLEDCLNHSIIIKKNPRRTPKNQADETLEKFRTFTLGKAIKISKSEKLLSDEIQLTLTEFLAERNWLVHRSIAHNRDDLLVKSKKEDLLKRVKDVTNKAKSILHQLEDDLMSYCSSNGADMSKVKAEIDSYYSN